MFQPYDWLILAVPSTWTASKTMCNLRRYINKLFLEVERIDLTNSMASFMYTENRDRRLYVHWNARGPAMVVPDGHLLYCWHHSCYAIWGVHAACKKVRTVGNQTKITKVSIIRFKIVFVYSTEFLFSLDTWRSTFGQSCSINFSIWRTSMICPICSTWSQKSTTNCTTWNRSFSHRYERFLTFCTSGRLLT